jgi:hypothetical protein
MALIRDPNWTGPGPGPLIDDGTGTPDTPVLMVVDNSRQSKPPLLTLPQQKRAAFSGATQDYIDQLRSGNLGGGVDTLNALNILVQQGEAKAAATARSVHQLRTTTTDQRYQHDH